jgi:NADH-quinone oxidoreductase subunit A
MIDSLRMQDYSTLVLFILITGFLVLTIAILALILSRGEKTPEKLSAYECGFNPFESSRQTFEIKFYLIAMLFILFDVEIALLLPFVLVFATINQFGFFICISFLLVLIIGFVYEAWNNALTWY